MEIFAHFAEKYLELGIVTLPIAPGGKAPKLKNWTQIFHDDIDHLIEKYPSHGIGVLCGKASGVIALDIDDDSILDKLPKSPVAKRGAKGETRFFRYNGEQSINFNGGELLSDGRQTVIPPTIHPDLKKPYFWTTEDTLLDFDPENLPTLKTTAFEFSSEVKKEGRHNKLVEIISAKIGEGIDPTRAVDEVMLYDQLNHSPPYFTDPSEPHRGSGYLAALKMYTSLAETVKRKGNFNVERPRVELLEAPTKISWKKLPKLRGVGDDLFWDLYNNAPIPRTQFAAMQAMATISILLGNKLFLHDKGLIGANLYTFGIANSGFGKDAPFRRSLAYINHLTPHKVGGTDPTSRKNIYAYLEQSREIIFPINEADSLFMRMNNPRMNHGLSQFATELFDYPGKTLNAQKMTEKDRHGNHLQLPKIISPYVCYNLWCTQTAFRDTVKISYFDKGFGSRFLYFFEDRPKRIDLDRKTDWRINQNLVRDLGEIAKWRDQDFIARSAGVSCFETAIAHDFTRREAKLTPQAQKEMRAVMEACADEFMANSKSRFSAIYSRKNIMASKLALIDHAMQNPNCYETTPIQAGTFEWAYEMASAIHHNMFNVLDDEVSEAHEDERMHTVLSIIKDHKTIGKSTLLKKAKISARQLNDFLITLEESDRVQITNESTSGRPKQTVRFIA